MADAVTTQVLENGPRRIVALFTNFSDGTGESDITKIDATASGPFGVVQQGQTIYPGTHLTVVSIQYDVRVMAVRMQWKASSNQDFWIASGSGAGPIMMLDRRGGFQGIYPPAIAGVTGSISFTTSDHVAKASYSIILEMTKGI